MSKHQIVSRLFGGAGNQLFQYAAGRTLADRLGCELVIDNRYVAHSSNRGDCFGHFTNARFSRSEDLPPSKSDGTLRYTIWRAFGRSPRIYREKAKAFDPQVLALPVNTYLHGYWQSERYFEEISEKLRDDLTFTTALNTPNLEIAAQIEQATTAVSLHVRRGDYVAAGAYAACTEEYYQKAVAHLADLYGSLTCFVFSNDPTWVKQNLKLGQPMHVVEVNDETTGHFDLHLQSLCDHHIIANSTFSWWAAWLNSSQNKTVIAPKNWFMPKEGDNPDLIPTRWIKL